MERRRILILNGHPDPDPARFCHALAAAYARGAASAGHTVHRINLSDMDFPLLETRQDWETGQPCEAIRALQDNLGWAEHLVVIYPLWLGTMPARLKGLLEETFRPTFAFGGEAVTPRAGRLKGRSARVIVTMGMPTLVYRTVFMGHSLKALKNGILGLVGFGPVRDTVLGSIEGRTDHEQLVRRVQDMGAVAR